MPVMDIENKIFTAEEILRSAEKVQKNMDEDICFSEKLDKYLANTTTTTDFLTIGATPNALAIAGADSELNMVIAPRTIAKCMSEASERYHGHGLSAEIMKQLPLELRNPALIFKGSHDNSLVAITELKDKENREIMIAVNINEKGKRQEVNRISSAYGRNNMQNYLKAQMEQGNLIAVNKEKADKMLQSAGLQLPLEETFISFNDSIAYSTQNVKYPQENKLEKSQSEEVQTSEKMLPFLNAKANKLDSKIESLIDKKAVRADKITRNESKIHKLTVRADRLEDANRVLSDSFSGLPFVQSMIKRNEEKINEIRNERIPKREAKTQVHKDKMAQIDKKLNVAQHKLDRCIALNTAIRSFSISDNAERRQTFAQAMDNLHTSTIACLQDKRNSLAEKAADIKEKYELTDSSVKRIDLQKDLNSVNSKIQALTSKVEKLSAKHEEFSKKSDIQIDAAIDSTSQKVVEQLNSGEISISKLSEEICAVSSTVAEQKIEQENYLKNAEMSIEDDYNSIDGIINNGKKEPTDISNDEKTTRPEAINPEYYKSLPKSERHIVTLSSEVAQKVMQDLNEQGVQFSAVSRKNDTIAITVSDKDKPALDSAREAAKQQQCKEFINSDYYKSLSKEERFTQRMTEADARSTIQQLADNGIEHSAVLGGSRSAVTVNIKDEQRARPFFSNKQRRNEARRIQHQPANNKSHEKQHKQKQEIG